MNTSTDVITVLAGLDEVDSVFIDFADVIETLIHSGGTGMSPKSLNCCMILMLARKPETQSSQCCSSTRFWSLPDFSDLIFHT